MDREAKQSVVDARYGDGCPNRDPVLPHVAHEQTYVYDLSGYEPTGCKSARRDLTNACLDMNNTFVQSDVVESLEYTRQGRTEAWLDLLHPLEPFEDILFFDATNLIEAEALRSHSFYNGKALDRERLVGASIVLSLPNGQLYDRAAIEAFLDCETDNILYWGPEVEALPLAASSGHPFYSLPSYASTVADGEDEPCSYENGLSNDQATHLATLGRSSFCGDDGENDGDSDASFYCVTAAAREKVVVRNISPNLALKDLSFRWSVSWVPAKYVNKKKGPPPAIIISRRIANVEVAAVHPLTPFQRLSRVDKTITLRAMRDIIRGTPLLWPTHPLQSAAMQRLPPPRLWARPPRPNLSMLQPVHPEIKAQRETAKPLSLSVIERGPDLVPAQDFPLESRLASQAPRDPTLGIYPFTDFVRIELAPTLLHIDSKGIRPQHTPPTIQPLQTAVTAHRSTVKSESYNQRSDAKRQGPDGQLRTAIGLRHMLERQNPRAPRLLQPFRLLHKLLLRSGPKRR